MIFRYLPILLVLVTVALLALNLRAADAVPRPTAAEVRGKYDAGVLFVDVRTDDEWSAGHLRSALHLPVDAVASKAATILPDKDKPLVTYCQSGRRAEAAAESLRTLGYTKVTAMAGGYDELKAAGFPIDE